MRRAIIVPGLLAVVLATGQYLEKTIWLPDSFSVLDRIRAVEYVPGTNTLYIGAENGPAIVVLDATDFSRVAKIPAPEQTSSICFNPAENKVYASSWHDGDVTIIDVQTNQVLTTAQCAHDDVMDLLWVPAVNKVYCGSWDGWLTVIDGRSDTILAGFSTGDEARGICYCPVNNQVYVADVDPAIVIVDCTADTVLARLVVGRELWAIDYNPANNMVYCADWATDQVYVLDCSTDSIVDSVLVGETPSAICANPRENKVYVNTTGNDSISVIDCATNQVIKTIPSSSSVEVMARDSAANFIYCLSDWGADVVVIDCTADSVLKSIDLPGSDPLAAAFNYGAGKVYIAAGAGVSILESDSAELVGMLGVTGWAPHQFQHNAAEDKMYVATREKVCIIDGTNSEVTDTLDFGASQSMAYASAVDKLYLANRDSLVTVVDGAGDSILTAVVVDGGAWHLWYTEDHNKVLCSAPEGNLAVLDASSDTVLALLRADCRLWNPPVYSGRQGKVYYPSKDTLVVVDPVQNRISARIWMPDDFVAVCADRWDKLYCGLVFRQQVHVIDTRGDTLIGRIPIGYGAVGACYNPTADRVYIGCEDTVFVIDPGTDSIVAKVDCWNLPCWMICDSIRNRVYCVSSDSGDIIVIDGATDTTIVHFEGNAQGPYALGLNPGAGRVYVAGRENSTIQILRDTVPPGVAERGKQGAQGRLPGPTIVRDVLVWSATTPSLRNVRDIALHSRAELLDITGRRVMDLKPGENDIRHISPGVYFVREEGPRGQGSEGSARELAGCASSVRKVVIQR